MAKRETLRDQNPASVEDRDPGGHDTRNPKPGPRVRIPLVRDNYSTRAVVYY